MKVKSLSHVLLFVTPWTVAYHAPPSMGFSRQEYWSGVPKIYMIALFHLPEIFFLPTLSYPQSSLRDKTDILSSISFLWPSGSGECFPKSPLAPHSALTGVVPASLSQCLPSFLSEDRLGVPPLCTHRGRHRTWHRAANSFFFNNMLFKYIHL